MSLRVSNVYPCRLAKALLTILLGGTLASFPLQLFGAEGKTPRFRTDRIIIQPKAGASVAIASGLNRQSSRRTLKVFEKIGGLQIVQLGTDENVEQVAAQYRKSGLVEFAEPDYRLRASLVPNDPHFTSGLQWPLLNSTTGRDIHAPEAWDVINSASNIVVAVVDSGIRYTHEDLSDNMWVNPGEIPNNGEDDDGNGLADDIYGINTVNGTGDPMDDGDHGTHVAGIIGAVGNNERGITGVAWKVKLMACKFLDADGLGYTSDAIEGIDYARRMGAHVINASFGGEDYSVALFNAIQSARNAGIVFVTAAGNEQINIDQIPIYPACYSLDNIIVVGGSTRSDTFDSSYSNYGANDVDLFAPGTGIYSTWGSSDTSYLSNTGTSMATPHVAGSMALMKARFPSYTPSQLIKRMLDSVDVLPAFSGRCRSGGRLNLAKALGSDPMAVFTTSALTGEPPLTVNFTNTSLGALSNLVWNFGDGSQPSTNERPSHIFARNGEFVVSLTVVGTNGIVSMAQKTVRVRSNYQFVSAPYSWIDPGGMTRISLSDNGISPAQTLPFSFPFYGTVRNSIYVAANGILGFAPDGLGVIDNVSLPNAAAPNDIIAPFWDNLNPGSAGNIYVGTVGVAPDRRFVVSWVSVPRVASTTFVSFQAILEENTGEIVFQFRDAGGGRSATVGIENSAGDAAALYSHNGVPSLIQNRTSLRATRKVFRYLVVDQNQLSLDATRGSTTSSNAPLSLENTGNTNLNWSVTPSGNWITVSTATGTLTGGQITQIQIHLTPEGLALAPGSYETTLDIVNESNGGGNLTLPVEITIRSANTILDFTGTTNSLFTGGLGGPFAPSEITVQLRNSGGGSLDWTGSTDASWVAIVPVSGQLAPGESTSVSIGLSTNAISLVAGLHTGLVEFQNLSASDSTPFQQAVQLQVNASLAGSSAAVHDGKFHAEIGVAQAGNYAIEYSPDLITWETLTSATAEEGRVAFEDFIIPGAVRFYRLRLL